MNFRIQKSDRYRFFKKIFVILLCGASNVRSECQTQLRWTAHHIVQMNHGNHSNIVEEMKIYANFSYYMLTLIGFLFQYFFSKKIKPVVFFTLWFSSPKSQNSLRYARSLLMFWWRLTQNSTLSYRDRADLGSGWVNFVIILIPKKNDSYSLFLFGVRTGLGLVVEAE